MLALLTTLEIKDQKREILGSWVWADTLRIFPPPLQSLKKKMTNENSVKEMKGAMIVVEQCSNGKSLKYARSSWFFASIHCLYICTWGPFVRWGGGVGGRGFERLVWRWRFQYYLLIGTKSYISFSLGQRFSAFCLSYTKSYNTHFNNFQ